MADVSRETLGKGNEKTYSTMVTMRYNSQEHANSVHLLNKAGSRDVCRA